ncbi:unnamed protein product [Dibothriocephalus latus]|uniref:Zinc finger C5HC2-type domain-containing protein n=1 Tax=Dibothriocephalus latus TaxID=60516 RepID=A0A3P7PVC9_DIBLA|nr:unnamed protein product [Dibothriocephalus latus]
MVCLEHYQARSCCSVEDQVMLYRYGLDELSDFIERPQARLQQYSEWKSRVLQGTQSVAVGCMPEGSEKTRLELSSPGSNTKADLENTALHKREEGEKGTETSLSEAGQEEQPQEDSKPATEPPSPIFSGPTEGLSVAVCKPSASRPSLSDIQMFILYPADISLLC